MRATAASPGLLALASVRLTGGWAVAVAGAAFLSEEDDQSVRPVLRSAGPEETDEALGPAAEPSSPRGTVLVADDDDGMRETLVDILGFSGYDVLQAVDGDDTLRVLGQQSVDVLLLDLAMPKRDGLSVLEVLGPPPPKVVILSAFEYYGPKDIDHMGLGRKVTRALRKPCPPVELLAAVSDAMDELHRGD